MTKVPQRNGVRKRARPAVPIASASQSRAGESPPIERLVAGLVALENAPTAKSGSIQAASSRALQGRIETVSLTAIVGWAWDPQTPNARICLELIEDENRLSVVVADDSRPDLVQLGCGDGRHGFSIGIDEALLSEGRHILTLRCADTGSSMPGSPIVIEARKALAEGYSMRPRAARSELHPTFRGYIDKVTDKEILGWIIKPDQPSHRCVVVLKENGRVLARTVASQFRHDLLSAGIGDGCYSFVFEPSRALLDDQDHMLEVVEEETETSITTEPIRWHPDVESGPTTSACLSETEFVDGRWQSTDIVTIIHSVISKVRSRSDLSLGSHRHPEVTVSLAKMYSLDDAGAVFYSYRTILGCRPDATSFAKLVNGLRRGTFDRRKMIELLQLEPNAGRAHFIEDLPEPGPAAAPANINDTRAFYSINEFPKENADAFLALAYRNILRRDPDPVSRATHRKSMEDGVSESQILASLLGSEEFKERLEPMVILGVTPDDELFQLLFTMIEQMSRIIVHHDYEICLLKDRSERPSNE
jgi:hypothetical protein